MTKTKTVTKHSLDYSIVVSDLCYCLVVSVCLHETLSNKKWTNSIDFTVILANYEYMLSVYNHIPNDIYFTHHFTLYNI